MLNFILQIILMTITINPLILKNMHSKWCQGNIYFITWLLTSQSSNSISNLTLTCFNWLSVSTKLEYFESKCKRICHMLFTMTAHISYFMLIFGAPTIVSSAGLTSFASCAFPRWLLLLLMVSILTTQVSKAIKKGFSQWFRSLEIT